MRQPESPQRLPQLRECPHRKGIQAGELYAPDCRHSRERCLSITALQYRQHPEAKSLAPDGTPCKPDTIGLLQRAHVVAGEVRYVGKETDHKWEQGDDISVLEFRATEYGRNGRVVASQEVRNKILSIGINRCARESGFDRKTFIRKLIRGTPVKRNSYNEFLRWLQYYESSHT